MVDVHICIFIEVRFFFDMLLIIAHYNFIPRNKSRKKIPSTSNPVPFPPLLHSFNSFFPFPNRTIRAIDGYCSFLERSLRDKRAVVFERHRCTGLSSTEDVDPARYLSKTVLALGQSVSKTSTEIHECGRWYEKVTGALTLFSMGKFLHARSLFKEQLIFHNFTNEIRYSLRQFIT